MMLKCQHDKMSSKYFTSKLIKLLLMAAVCGLLIFLNPKQLFDPIRGFLLGITRPFQKTFYILSEKTRDTFGFLASIGELKEDNERLLRENTDLAARLADLESQRSENAVLREQLDLAPRNKYDLEGAFVIGQDPSGAGLWIAISKGESDGIRAGMPVIVSDGVLVGKVEEAHRTSAKVSLITDPDSSVNVEDIGTGAPGIVKGAYGLGLIMDMVEQSDVLNEGDTISTSGLGGMFPKGFLIGQVGQIVNTPDKLFQQAVVKPAANYSKLDVVFAVKSSLDAD